MFKQTSTSEPKAAHHRRFAESHVSGRRVEAAAKTLLIETWAGHRSSVARWSARFGCASVRIVEPRRIVDATVCPPVVPAQVTTWSLNLHSQMDRVLLRDFISDQAASGLWARIVLVTSPPCTPWSRWQSIRLAKIKKLLPHQLQVKMSRYQLDRWRGFSNINFARGLHLLLRESCEKAGITMICVHEQPFTSDMFRNTRRPSCWPWAIGEHSERARVDGCAVNLRTSTGILMRKAWQFEVLGSAVLLSTLRSLHCRHTSVVEHAYAEGRETKRTESYTGDLGAIIALGALK